MTDANPWIENRTIALFTDLYELTMMQAYHACDMEEDATFSLFVRRLPEERNYLLACGLDDVLRYLEALRFDPESIAYLASLGQFRESFLAWLKDFRFTGSVRAVAEGTPVFADEPILEVTAPIAEAQLVETFVMNQVHLQTTLASKAARVVTAAAGRPVVDFGPRRMHGTDAAVKAARAFHIAGVAATSNVFAGKVYDVPVQGTMAHSLIQAWDREADAFRAFAALYPETVLLVDTFDTLKGVDTVCALAQELGERFRVRAIRLDSGDLAELAIRSREKLDGAGLSRVRIFASGSLDEFEIRDLLSKDAPIDGFGVGTRMGVSQDAPSLDIAYKLVAYGGSGRLKLSTGKSVLPGAKQVFREERGGVFAGDTIAREGEDLPGRPLLNPVMAGGRRRPEAADTLDRARKRAAEAIARLPGAVRAIDPAAEPYPVRVSETLAAYRREVEEALAR